MQNEKLKKFTDFFVKYKFPFKRPSLISADHKYLKLIQSYEPLDYK